MLYACWEKKKNIHRFIYTSHSHTYIHIPVYCIGIAANCISSVILGLGTWAKECHSETSKVRRNPNIWSDIMNIVWLVTSGPLDNKLPEISCCTLFGHASIKDYVNRKHPNETVSLS